MRSGKRAFWYVIDQILGLFLVRVFFIVGGLGMIFAGIVSSTPEATISGSVVFFGYLIVRAIVWTKIDDS